MQTDLSRNRNINQGIHSEYLTKPANSSEINFEAIKNIRIIGYTFEKYNSNYKFKNYNKETINIYHNQITKIQALRMNSRNYVNNKLEIMFQKFQKSVSIKQQQKDTNKNNINTSKEHLIQNQPKLKIDNNQDHINAVWNYLGNNKTPFINTKNNFYPKNSNINCLGQSQCTNPFNSSNNNINNNNEQVNFNNNNGVTNQVNVHDIQTSKQGLKYKNKSYNCLNHQEINDKLKYENYNNETNEQQLKKCNNNGKAVFSPYNHIYSNNHTPSNSNNIFISTYCPLKLKINSTKTFLGTKTKRFNSSSEDSTQLITADQLVE
jgi:hypothetical protein